MSTVEADDLSTREDDTRPLDISSNEPSEGTLLAKDLVRRCQKLLSELETFHEYLKGCSQEHAVEVKPFRNAVQAESRSLDKLCSLDPTAEKTLHTLRSSNLPFHIAVWDAAKSSTGLVTFTKRFYWEAPPSRSSKRAQSRKQKCALVDVVAQDGQQWIKVSTVTETRLLFELAKAGWEAADSASDSDGDDRVLVNGLSHTNIDGSPQPDQAYSKRSDSFDDRVEIVCQAHDLQKAALAHKVRYKHPSVTFVLPKISSDPPAEIARVLDTIRATGASIHLGQQPTSSDLLSNFQSLVSSPSTHLTATLNIDCTILLALVSDLSHNATNPEPWFHRAISRQIEMEKHEQLLPTILWPAMADRSLVCTAEAARRMREIVDTLGTENERIRTNLLLSDSNADQTQGRSREDVRKSFQELSTYSIPSSWQIPIRVVAFEPDLSTHTSLPPVASKVGSALSVINQSVFLYGWVTGYTTMSSNRTVAKQIEEIVEAEEGEVVGPKVWLCATARSLVGKEKGRRDLGKLEKEAAEEKA
ncbi:MAG: hypothetical protein Q9183_002519 [Haloplaca sp. 2 TL-2023]